MSGRSSTTTENPTTSRTRRDGTPQRETRLQLLFRELYEEVHRMARFRMQQQRPNHTLQTTALLHEAFLKLSVSACDIPTTQAGFLRLLGTVMRTLLIDHARARLRGCSPRPPRPLDHLVGQLEARGVDFIDLDRNLSELETQGAKGARAVRVVELRFVCGLEMEEIANLLGCSVATTERDWSFARAWLRVRLSR